MSRFLRAIVFLFALFAFGLFPMPTKVTSPPQAQAASGATFAFPPNHIFESGPKSVGSGPTNYDFSNGGTGWTKTGGGSVTYSGGIATLSGGVILRSSSYVLSNPVQAVKIRYKYVAATSPSVNVNIYVGGTSYGGDNLACPLGCTDGQWTEKYIGFFEAAQGQTVTVRITQTGSTTTTEVDYLWRSMAISPRMARTYGRYWCQVSAEI